jgi:hypothetical protein
MSIQVKDLIKKIFTLNNYIQRLPERSKIKYSHEISLKLRNYDSKNEGNHLNF